MIKPRRMKSSDILQVIMPSSSLKYGAGFEREFAYGLKTLQRMFRVANSKYHENEHLGLAAPDEIRAREFNDAIRSAQVGGMIAGRGGYGTLRMITHVDYKAIKRRPKPIVGLSDITILQLAVYQNSGVVTFSGPLVLQSTETSVGYLARLLLGSSKNLDLIPEGNKPRCEVLSEGSAEGVLLGGNLYSMVQLAGTGLLPRFDNSILFIEDIDETVDHIDSYLQHLKLAGALYHVAGVVIGDISWSKDQPTGSGAKSDELLQARLEGMFRQGTPIIRAVDYGHIDDSITIPIGVRARLDTASRSLTLLEEATDE